ncbi:MAG TPA: sensor histidine kinase [Lacunisphaera sp.]
MNPDQYDAHRSGSLYGAFAFASIVLTCFGGYFFTGRFYGPAEMVPVTFALGAVYVALGVLSNECLLSAGSARPFVIYYLAQGALLTAMVFLSPARGFFGMIVLPVVSQAIFDLRPRNAALVGGYLLAACVGVWWIDFGWGAAVEAVFNYAAGFAFTIAFTLITKRALDSRAREEKLRREIEAAHEQLKAYAAQAEDLATTRERNRVAREIHDGVGHYLTVVKTQLDAAAAILPGQPDLARASILKAAQLTGDALDDVRRSVGALRTDTARPPLPEALQALVRDAGLPVSLRLAGTTRPLAAGLEHALYRSAQEGLTNIRKHAGATAAELALDFTATGKVTLTVADNGRGANGTAASGFGLVGIRERIEILGGRVQAGNQPGGGYLLTIEVPA